VSALVLVKTRLPDGERARRLRPLKLEAVSFATVVQVAPACSSTT
jgi:hypothetical protein